MTESDEVLRAQEFATDGPITLDVRIGAGQIDVQLVDDDGPVQVQLRHDPASAPPWSQGVTNTLSWLSEQIGEQIGPQVDNSPISAADQTRIEMFGDRLVVRAPKTLPLRHVPLALTVRAPAGSGLEVRTASARIAVTGDLANGDLATTSGDIEVDNCDGPLTARTGAGSLTVSQAASGMQVRSGSGDVLVGGLAGSSTVVTGTGSVRVQTLDGTLTARTGSGDVTVADAGSGEVNLKAGSGSVQIGVRSQTLAEVELSSGTGDVSSELEVAEAAPEDPVALHVRARTGTGNAAVTAAR